MTWTTIYDADIQRAAARYLPTWSWLRIKSQLIAESDLDPNAVSPVGAQGIAQMMPDTWPHWRDYCGYDESVTPFQPTPAINCMCAYMRYLYREWMAPRTELDRWRLAVASYNAGLGGVLKAQRAANEAPDFDSIKIHLPDETVGYVGRIEIILSELQQ